VKAASYFQDQLVC